MVPVQVEAGLHFCHKAAEGSDRELWCGQNVDLWSSAAFGEALTEK